MAVIGWKAGAEQFAPQELLECALVAEEVGFESIDVSDHFHPWSEEGQAPFAWTWLGAVAARTQKISMGPGVTCPILRYHPAIIAQATATLSHFAPGRVYLGLGAGEALNEYPVTHHWPTYTERRERLKEAIEIIRALWAGEKLSYAGKYYQTKEAKLYTPPKSAIPIYISALVPESARFAGEYGDGLIIVGGKPEDLYKQVLKNFSEGGRAAKKDPDKMAKLIELNMLYTNDEETSIQHLLTYWAGTFVPALFNQKIYSPAMSAQNGEVVGPDTVRKTCCVSGDPKVQAQYIQKHIDLGFDHIFVHSGDKDQKDYLRRFGKDVLPRVHAMVAAH
ncbi:TIGR03557 family F420-dependent LLM class oxidoreductase [Ktedonospora formicarum]|uniref:LLM class F420-dependent oxidoreductase n=1 Tax=Ktedonospora formicarum TaxID=2778364 RepID=A0A8J3HY07_9CHLR|nr:TIGR03557 family F420-dependent LLM class oxidoreductase [Ktedonospora formicarum]GHO42712.1 LLM class F420-dependent oxidoreductase [Ktedonospora formicarum]